jgi:hypothetical protein
LKHQLLPKFQKGAIMKNPFMSMFLSGANKIAGSARAQASAAVKREAAKNARQVTKAWTDALLAPGAPRKRKRAPK